MRRGASSIFLKPSSPSFATLSSLQQCRGHALEGQSAFAVKGSPPRGLPSPGAANASTPYDGAAGAVGADGADHGGAGWPAAWAATGPAASAGPSGPAGRPTDWPSGWPSGGPRHTGTPAAVGLPVGCVADRAVGPGPRLADCNCCRCCCSGGGVTGLMGCSPGSPESMLLKIPRVFIALPMCLSEVLAQGRAGIAGIAANAGTATAPQQHPSGPSLSPSQGEPVVASWCFDAQAPEGATSRRRCAGTGGGWG